MCLNPRTIVVPRFPSGTKAIQVPCGKCLECLKRYQNDIMIRIIEESKNWPKMVFFTLTYAPHSIHCNHVDIDDYAAYYETGEYDPETMYPIVQYFDALSPESRSYLEKHDGMFYEVNTKDVQSWIKRFREFHVQYVSRIKKIPRKDVERLKMKYFYTTEYGPQTLRPHGHGIIWYDYPDYLIHRLFSQWRERFGYVDYTIIPAPKSLVDDTMKIARYVAKYCSKGMFESPLVKDGIAKKCSKLYSNGIGSSYADDRRSYHLAVNDYPSEFFYSGQVELPVVSQLDPKNKRRVLGFYAHYAKEFQKVLGKRGYTDPISLFEPSLDVKSPILERCCYTMLGSDGKLYKYPLPRYLKNKIYGQKSLLSFALSAAMAESILLDYRDKFRIYKCAHPSLSDYEIDSALARQDSALRDERASAFYERTLRHYKKSKL